MPAVLRRNAVRNFFRMQAVVLFCGLPRLRVHAVKPGLELLLRALRGLEYIRFLLLRQPRTDGGCKDIGTVGGADGGFIRVAAVVVKACGRFPVAYVIQLLYERLGLLPRDDSFLRVQRLAVGARNQSHIVDAFHAALDLDGVHARFFHVVQMLDHAKVLAGQHRRKVISFIDGKILAGALMLLEHQRAGFRELFRIGKHVIVPAA